MRQGYYSEEVYLEYSAKFTVGFASRYNDVKVKRKFMDEMREERLKEDVDKRRRLFIQSLKPFPLVSQVEGWKALFSTASQFRFPFLCILGASQQGKSTWAMSLFDSYHFNRIGDAPSDTWPSTMRTFDRARHACLILDDVRDRAWLVKNQEKLQGTIEPVELSSTPGGQCSYVVDLYAVPIIVTMNFTTANRELLEKDDFLSNPKNRVFLTYPQCLGKDFSFS